MFKSSENDDNNSNHRVVSDDFMKYVKATNIAPQNSAAQSKYDEEKTEKGPTLTTYSLSSKCSEQ